MNTEAKIRELYEVMGVTEHPILRLPSAGAVMAALSSEERKAELVETLRLRQQRIKLAEQDPMDWGFELETWRDADRILGGGQHPTANIQQPTSNGEGNGEGEGGQHPTSNIQQPTSNGELENQCDVLGIFGGNRSGKTFYAVKRGVQTAELFGGARVAILSEGVQASITTVQAMVWYYVRGRYGHLNGKRDVVFKLNYTQANGFSDNKLVLPNGSEIYFLTYGQEAGDFEGWEFGAPAFVYEKRRKEIEAEGKPCIPNIGAVADESMTLKWLQMLSRRVKFRKAKLLWPFTPVKGITPAVKELVGSSAETVESKPSELLPRRNFPDLKEGTMPYIQRCAFPKAWAIYFFSCMSPFGASPGRTYYDEIKQLCEGKTSEYTERVAYGVARDTVARAFPKFGPWNVVKRTALPAVGTNYHFIDPAGSRNWFMLWVRVAPGNPPSLYIYRDWPDAATYGEWAVPTEREVNDENRKGWDGDAGPAQAGLGMGVVGYKKLILECERVKGGNIQQPTANIQHPTSNSRQPTANVDPQHVRLMERAMRDRRDLGDVREEIAERFIDPRAAASEHLAEEGGTCITDEFAEEQRDGSGKVTGPAMYLTPASGVGRRQGTDENEGLTLINEMLDWNEEAPLCAVLNQPHLFVSEDCVQVRWMFENYTGRGGEKGASKDPADLARYMALAKLEHVGEAGRKMKAGRGF